MYDVSSFRRAASTGILVRTFCQRHHEADSPTPILNRQIRTLTSQSRDNPSSGGNVTAAARNDFTDVYTAEASINVDNRIPRTTKHTYSAMMYFPFMSIKLGRSLGVISVLATAWACFNEPVKRTPYSAKPRSLG